MTLPEYLFLTREVAAAIGNLKEAFEAAESEEEVEELASRLRKALASLAEAKCGDAGSSEHKEARRLIEEGNAQLERANRE